MLATYLLLFREAKDSARLETAHALGRRVRAQLHDALGCIELRRFQKALLNYVLHSFLGPNYEKDDPSVPHWVGEDYEYTPPVRRVYRDRGPLF